MLIQDMNDEDSLSTLMQAGFGRLGCAYKNQPYIVPVYFACSGRTLYGFSTFGQKIRWMRANPRVCIEVDELDEPFAWRSVIAFGRYEELSDLPEWETERKRARALLEERSMWWMPATIASTHRGATYDVWYRIHVERLTGFRAAPDPWRSEESSPDVPVARSRGWFGRLLGRSG